MKHLADKISLSEHDMMEVMDRICSGRMPDEEIILFLTQLAARGETIAEITGAARFFRQCAIKVTAPKGTLDCCGTGGDRKNTYNISTAVAIVAASCGVPVAKHGNRASSSQSGAADVLEALGVKLEISAKAAEQALQEFNFAFLMAPYYHPSLARVRDIRRRIATPTIFNILGPLLNPANVELQLLGVYKPELVPAMAQVLKNLGSKRAWVVHGSDGTDEIILNSRTLRAILDNAIIVEDEIDPAQFGLDTLPDTPSGGMPPDNATALKDLLSGAKGAYRDTVIANTAAALCLHGTTPNLHDGAERAAEALDRGRALQTLERYAAFSQKALP